MGLLMADRQTHEVKLEIRLIDELVDTLTECCLTIGKKTDEYIGRLEVEAETLEILNRRLNLDVNTVRAWKNKGELRLEGELKREILKLIETITEEVKSDARNTNTKI
jgi:hypothetical protein